MKFWQSLQFTPTEQLVPLARALEETAFHGAFLGDHSLHPQQLTTPYPYTPDGKVLWPADTHWPDISSVFGAFANATRRLHFMSSIMILPLRHPFEIAKMLATVSVLSDNRAALGIGLGWMEDEFRALGIDFASRAKRCDEMIEVMRLLWTGAMVEYHGQHFDFPPSQLAPTPVGRVPVYIGGDSPAALRRAARSGDGWISSGLSAEAVPKQVATLQRLRAEAGRSREPFEVIATLPADLQLIRQMRDGGITAVCNVSTLDEIAGRTSLADRIGTIRRYADEIIARL